MLMKLLKMVDTVWALLFLFGGFILGFLLANENNKVEMDYLTSELEHQSLTVIKQSGVIENQSQDLTKKILMIKKAIEIIKEKEAEIELLKQGRNYANKSPNEDIKAITQAADLD